MVFKSYKQYSSIETLFGNTVLKRVSNACFLYKLRIFNYLINAYSDLKHGLNDVTMIFEIEMRAPGLFDILPKDKLRMNDAQQWHIPRYPETRSGGKLL